MKLNRDRRHRQPSPMDPSSAICVQAADIPTSLLRGEMKGGTAEPSEHVKRNARPTKSKDSALEAPHRSVDGDFYNIRQFVGRPGSARPSSGVRREESSAHHQSVLGTSRIPVRNPARVRRPRYCRRAVLRLWLLRKKRAARRPHHDGACAHRLLHRDIPWCAQRSRHGLDLLVRF